MSNPTDVAIDHPWEDPAGGCLCGWRGDFDGYRAHLSQMFSDAGFWPTPDTPRE